MLTVGIIIVVLALVLFAVSALYILIPWGIKVLLRKRFLAIVKKSGYVCLTFDDGPNPKSTPEVLQILKETGVKATFFVLGKNVTKHPELTSQIVDSGHEIGMHSYRHLHPWKCMPFNSLTDLIRGTHTIQNYLCSNQPVLFRPPFGKLNLITLLYVFFSHKRLAFWNIDPKDYKQESADLVLKHVTERIFPGTVVLLHDGRWNSSNSADATVLALRSIVKETANRGLTLAKVSEALTKDLRKMDYS